MKYIGPLERLRLDLKWTLRDMSRIAEKELGYTISYTAILKTEQGTGGKELRTLTAEKIADILNYGSGSQVATPESVMEMYAQMRERHLQNLDEKIDRRRRIGGRK